MDTDGLVAPRTEEAVREHYEAVAPAARSVVREVARALELDREEYAECVTEEVESVACDALFASLLQVDAGTREEFEAWAADFDGTVDLAGGKHVDNVAWHAAPFADRAVAVTFQGAREAAVETLRRRAFGEIYRELR